MNAIRNITFLLILSVGTFSFSNFLLDGSLNSPCRLGEEIKSPCDSLYVWNISSEPPFKFRVLHKTIVNGIYKTIANPKDNNLLFFRTYQVIAFAVHFLAIVAFYYFLRKVNMSEFAMTGTLIFSLLPAFSMAYNLPVHTREDTLGYTLLLLGLMAILQNKIGLVLLFSVLGVLCRETLLLIAFTNLFFNRNQKIQIRLLIATISFSVFLVARFSNGFEPYNHWEGFNWNIKNLPQAMGFAFITFGLLWIPFFLQVTRKSTYDNRVRLIVDSAPWVFALVMLTTFLGGIFNEIRLLYILAPWVICVSLVYYQSNAKKIIEALRSRNTRIYFFLILLIFCVACIFAIKATEDHFTSRYNIPFSAWAVISLTQVALLLLSLPLIRHAYLRK